MLILLKKKPQKPHYKYCLLGYWLSEQFVLEHYVYLCSIRQTEILTTDKIHIHALNMLVVWIHCNNSCCFRWENVLNEMYSCGLCQVFHWRWEGCQDIWAILWLWGQWTEGVGDQRMGLQVRGHLTEFPKLGSVNRECFTGMKYWDNICRNHFGSRNYKTVFILKIYILSLYYIYWNPKFWKILDRVSIITVQ